MEVTFENRLQYIEKVSFMPASTIRLAFRPWSHYRRCWTITNKSATFRLPRLDPVRASPHMNKQQYTATTVVESFFIFCFYVFRPCHNRAEPDYSDQYVGSAALGRARALDVRQRCLRRGMLTLFTAAGLKVKMEKKFSDPLSHPRYCLAVGFAARHHGVFRTDSGVAKGAVVLESCGEDESATAQSLAALRHRVRRQKP